MISVVVEPTHFGKMLVKLDHFPRDFGVKIKKKHISNHHLDYDGIMGIPGITLPDS